MLKEPVVAVLMVLLISVSAHGHGGHGGMGGIGSHNFGGHGHAGNIGHVFSGHSFDGHLAERMNVGGRFTEFSKGSINMSGYPITDSTTHSISVKGGVVTKNITYNGIDERYSTIMIISRDSAVRTSTVNRDEVTKEAPTTTSADMRFHSVAVTNGTEAAMSIHSYGEGVGDLNVHVYDGGVNTYGSVHAYNDIANVVYFAHVIYNDELTRIGYNVVSPTQHSHTVTAKDGDYTHVHTAGYIGNKDVGFGWNKGTTRDGQYGLEHSVNSLGIATTGNFRPTYYGEKAANLKTGEVKTITNYQSTPQSTPVVTYVTPAVIVHVVPASIVTPATPSSSVMPTTTVYRDRHGDSVTLYWST